MKSIINTIILVLISAILVLASGCFDFGLVSFIFFVMWWAVCFVIWWSICPKGKKPTKLYITNMLLGIGMYVVCLIIGILLSYL